MVIRLLLIVSYIFFCLRHGAMPWRYFQLNAEYFNKQKGIFSKQDINDLVPEQWQLIQWQNSSTHQPNNYPVFFKPEWGQNSQGIERADNSAQFERIQRQYKATPYLIQQAAKEKHEFEIFIIPCAASQDKYAMLSITQVINQQEGNYPINGIHNKNTSYIDISQKLSIQQLSQLWKYIKKMGRFRIARVGVRADSIEQLIEGRFKVIEINLFLPMPLVLLTKNTSIYKKVALALNCTWQLAKITKTIPKEQNKPYIFFRKLGFIRRIKRTN